MSGPDRKEQEIWLVITLGDTLGLSLADEEPGTVLRVDGTVYRSAASTIQAFFDRLIDSRGILVGIRVAPVHKEGDHAFAGLRPRAYLRRSRDEHWIDVFFAASTRQDAESAGDQAFGGRIYQNDLGAVAISLDLRYLASSPDDIEAVRTAPVRWCKIDAI